MSKRKRQNRSTSQKILLLMSFIIAGSMVFSLVIVALPSGPASSTTPVPTAMLSPWPPPTEPSTPTALPPTLTPESAPTLEMTAPLIGPALPTETLALTATVTPTLTVSE